MSVDDSPLEMKIAAIATLPTRFGEFRIHVFSNSRDREEHVAMVRGDVAGGEEIACSVHSECLTGDAMGSLRCNCGAELARSMEQLSALPRAVLLYVRRRTCSSALADGNDPLEDRRPSVAEVEVVAAMLRVLDVRSVRMLTNERNTIEQLTSRGVAVCDDEPRGASSAVDDLDESA
jgi:GTP cyclohydrolase II